MDKSYFDPRGEIWMYHPNQEPKLFKPGVAKLMLEKGRFDNPADAKSQKEKQELETLIADQKSKITNWKEPRVKGECGLTSSRSFPLSRNWEEL